MPLLDIASRNDKNIHHIRLPVSLGKTEYTGHVVSNYAGQDARHWSRLYENESGQLNRRVLELRQANIEVQDLRQKQKNEMRALHNYLCCHSGLDPESREPLMRLDSKPARE